MEIRGFLIDLDGVLVKNKNMEIFEDSPLFVDYLHEKNIPFKIATNNSRTPPSEIADKLSSQGLNVSEEDIVSPLSILPSQLKSENIKSVFVIGEKPLIQFLTNLDFVIKNDPDVEAVLIGQDKTLNFEKIKIATTALKRFNAKLFALNNNLLSQDSDGLLFPGVGSVAKMFKDATNCCETFPHFGKMSDIYNQYIFSYFKEIPKNKLAIISDDLYIDLKGYKQLGLKTIFMTTGKYTVSDIVSKDLEPDFIFDNLTKLKEFLEKNDK